MVDGGKILSGSASELVTLVVTTSPIPSHPSLVLLRTLLNSFRKHLVDFENYNLLLVCDGFSRSDGKDQLCSKEAYQQFLDSVQELCASGELGNCQILELKSCHGYGLALSAALAEVVTEFVFVVQHDWLLVKDVDLGPVVNAMDLDATIKYVGLQSLTTLDYARRMQLRYNLQLPPDRHLCGLRLVPQLLWYDKPHLTRKKHYLEVVLPEAKMGVFQNPERRYGVDQMWPKLLHAENLEEEHLRHGTFFWDVGAEVVYHLSGRKLLAVDEDAETERSLVGPGSRTHVPRPQLEKARRLVWCRNRHSDFYIRCCRQDHVHRWPCSSKSQRPVWPLQGPVLRVWRARAQ